MIKSVILVTPPPYNHKLLHITKFWLQGCAFPWSHKQDVIRWIPKKPTFLISCLFIKKHRTFWYYVLVQEKIYINLWMYQSCYLYWRAIDDSKPKHTLCHICAATALAQSIPVGGFLRQLFLNGHSGHPITKQRGIAALWRPGLGGPAEVAGAAGRHGAPINAN